jgi:hypothetical protein
VPPPPFALSDIPYFLLRWSEEWTRSSLEHFAAPKLEDVFGIWQSPAAIAAPAERHHSLADERIGQGFVVVRPEGLKAEPARVISARPLYGRKFRRLQGFALDDGHLAPRSIEPNIPGNMPRRAAPAAVLLESMKPVVKRIINLPFDEATADPKPADAAGYRPSVDAAWDLVRFVPLLPWFACVGHDQFLPDNQPIHVQHLGLRSGL